MGERLRSYSNYFSSMFSLIPAQYRDVKDEDSSKEKRPGNEMRFWHLKKLSVAEQPLHKKKRIGASLEKSTTAQQQPSGPSVDNKKSLSLSELRRRLREKMEQKSVSKLPPNGGSGNRRVRKRKGGREIDRKQQRVEEKKKRKDAAKKEREVKQKKVAVEVAKDNRDNETSPQFSFSRLEFNESSVRKGEIKSERISKKNYKALIAKAEAKQSKLQELLEKDEERGEVAQEKQMWSKAISMARGEKVRDDPTLLRKTVKRLEKKKLSNAKKWQERVNAEHQRQNTRQKKRKENIRERVEKIKSKKLQKKAKKRGFS